MGYTTMYGGSHRISVERFTAEGDSRLGARLHEAGIPGKTIQAIMRHADVSTAQAYSIKPTVEERAKPGLRELSKVLATKYKIGEASSRDGRTIASPQVCGRVLT